MISYIDKLALVRKYYKTEFKTRKNFNQSEKTIITRRYNKILDATQGEFKFISGKHPGYVNTNRGAFIPVPTSTSTTDGIITRTGGMTFLDIKLPRKIILGLLTGKLSADDARAFIGKNKDFRRLIKKNNKHKFAILYQGKRTPYAGPSDFTKLIFVERYLNAMNNISADKIIGVRVILWRDVKKTGK